MYSRKRSVRVSSVTLDWNTVSHQTGADFFKEQHPSHTSLVSDIRKDRYLVQMTKDYP